MPNFTSRYNLQKDLTTENYDVEVVNANLDKIAQNLGAIICTSLTRPSSPVEGMIIFETDSRKTYVYQGGSWWQERAGIYSGPTASRPTVGLYEGYPYYNTERDWLEIYDGAAWRISGTAICTSVADRNSVITSPVSGQLVVTTDNDTLWQYDGATAAWVCMAAKGVIARGNRTSASSGVSSDLTDIGVIRVSSVRLLPGRLYKIWTSPLALDSSSTNDEIRARIRFTTNNTNATTSSTILPGSTVNTRQTDANIPDQRVIQVPYSTGVEVIASFLLCVQRIAGAGTITIANNASEGYATDLVIEDVGTDPGDTGVDI
jgi:hypothetical protein